MADKSFGLKQVNLIGASGTPRIESPNNLNINAVNVAISTDMSVGGGLDVDGHTELDNLNVSGVSTFVGVGTFQGDLYVGGELTVTDTFLKPHAVGLGTTNTTGRDAGISTATGTVIYDADVGMQVYNGVSWKTIADTSTGVNYGTYTTTSLFSYWDISNPNSYTGSTSTLTDIEGNANLSNSGDNPTIGGSGLTKHIVQASGDYPYYTASNRNFGLGNVSIEIWAFTTGRTGDDYLFNFYSGTNQGQSRAIRLNNSNIDYGFVGNGSTPQDQNNVDTISANTWYQFVFTLSNYNGLTIYKNGTSVNSWTKTLNDGGGGVAAIGNTHWYGANSADVWKGGWALCRFYTKTLSGSEVTANWNGTKSRFGL